MRNRWLCSMLALAVIFSVTACGEQSGVPESGSGNFDTVFTGPTAWDDTEEDVPEESVPDVIPEIEESVETPVSVEVEESVSENTIAEEPEESETVPEEKTVPEISELLGLTSVEATERMSGLLRGNIIVAWGNPNGAPDAGLYANKDLDGRDKWTVQTTSGEVSIYIRYGYASGQATAIEAYTRYEGWENRLWDDMTGAEFATWVADTADMVPVLNRMMDMTRHDIVALLGGWAEGCCFTEDEVFIGDVFKIYGTEEGTSYFLLVKYDEELQSYPIGVKFYRMVGDDGRRLTCPEVEEGILYSTGKYNQAKFTPEYKTNK